MPKVEPVFFFTRKLRILVLLSPDCTVPHENRQSWNIPDVLQESLGFWYRIGRGCIHLARARHSIILSAFLTCSIQCAEEKWTRQEWDGEVREMICIFNVVNGLCRSLHVPSDSVECMCTLFRGRRCIPEPDAVQGGLAEEGEGVVQRSIAGTDLSLAVVRFIHRDLSKSRLRSRCPPFVLFLSSFP